MVSTDGGASFTSMPGAPLLLLVDFAADGRLVGLGPSGEFYASDNLQGWKLLGTVDDGQVQALAAGPGGTVWVATTEGLHRSTDGGASFSTALVW